MYKDVQTTKIDNMYIDSIDPADDLKYIFKYITISGK